MQMIDSLCLAFLKKRSYESMTVTPSGFERHLVSLQHFITLNTLQRCTTSNNLWTWELHFRPYVLDSKTANSRRQS